MRFMTAIYGGDSIPETRFSKIALNQSRNPMLYIDLITTFPTLATGYQLPWMYYFKVLRIFELKASQIIGGSLILKLKGVRDIKKQTIKKIDYFFIG